MPQISARQPGNKTTDMLKPVFAAIFSLLSIVGVAGQRNPVPSNECGLGTKFQKTGPASIMPSETAPHSGPVPVESGIIRVDTELVVAEFDVRDKKGRQVLGLRQDEVRVEEDGVEQQIEIFAFGKESAVFGRTIILIIDYSQSQAPYIDTSIEASKILVDMLEPADRLAIVTDDVELVSDFTSDRALLKQRLDELRIRSISGSFGRSKQLTALYAAVSQLFDPQEKRPVVILQTDGDQFPETSLWTGRGDNRECKNSFRNFRDLEQLLDKAGATVYSVIPGIPNELSQAEADGKDPEQILVKLVKSGEKVRTAGFPAASRRYLQSWAKARMRDAAAISHLSQITGGISQYLDSPERASEVYRRILDAMNKRYLLAYYPSNQEITGRKRTIKIKTRQDRNYTFTGRSAYFPVRK